MTDALHAEKEHRRRPRIAGYHCIGFTQRSLTKRMCLSIEFLSDPNFIAVEAVYSSKHNHFLQATSLVIMAGER